MNRLVAVAAVVVGALGAACALAGTLVATPAAAPSSAAARAQAAVTLFDAPVVLLRHAQLFDGTGSPPRVDQDLLLRDGRVAAVGPSGQVAAPAGALVRELAGAAVTPGFVLLHEHFFYPVERGSYGEMFRSFPPLYLAGGVTTLRTAGSMSPYADLNTWRDIQAGEVVGPDMDVTAPFLNGATPFVEQLPRIETPEDADRMVRYWADEGATSFKGYMHLTHAQLAAIIPAAHAKHAKVTAHLCSITYREAADLGIDDLEHGFLIASDFVPGKRRDECPADDAVGRSLDALAVDDPRMQALQDHLRARHVAITSTLTIFETYAHGRPMAPAGALDLLIPELREQYVRTYARIQRGGPNLWGRLLPKGMAWEKHWADAGGLLVAGTDPTGYGGVVPGFSATRELELLVEAGFTTAQALRVMTLNGATYLGREADVGTLAEGKRADLVVFEAPIVDGKSLPAIAWTMKSGRAYDRARILSNWKGKVGLE